MTDDIAYCANGCARQRGEQPEPRQAEPGLMLCKPCVERMGEWLREIPDRYALVPGFVLPETQLDAAPGSKAGKRTESPAPLRLAALDLLDQRRGRKWQGLVPTEDRRGALGIVHAWAEYIRAGRNTSTALKPNVARETHTILTSLAWLAADPAAPDAYRELRQLHRELGKAIGIHPPRPVGYCTTVADETVCGGPLLPTKAGEVHCPRCHRHFGHLELRFLGTLIEEEQTA